MSDLGKTVLEWSEAMARLAGVERKEEKKMILKRKVHPVVTGLFVVFCFVIFVPPVSKYLGNREKQKTAEAAFRESAKPLAEAIRRKAERWASIDAILSTFSLSDAETAAVRRAIGRVTDRTFTAFHLLRMIEIESGGNPKAVGAKGERGLLQVMPWIARPHLARLGRSDLFDPETNILVGTMELKRLLVVFEGDLGLALAAYNGGPTRSLRYASRVTAAARADNCSTWNAPGRAK